MIDARVGEGAMGRVYRAHHARLARRQFAIKILLGELAAAPEMRMRFEQEAHAASRLDHPNVVPVLDFGQRGGLLYIVMEFVEGRTLAKIIDEEGPLEERRMLDLSRQLALGLAHAHEQDLVHRDFKPENVVVITREGTEVPRILDFGLAIISDPSEAATRLTSAGMIVGTPAYLSPEQSAGKDIDHRADLFALGITMYEMLAGTLPFSGSIMEILAANSIQEPPPIAERTPGVFVPAELEAIVRKLMAKSPDERFGSAREVIDALDNMRTRRGSVVADVPLDAEAVSSSPQLPAVDPAPPVEAETPAPTETPAPVEPVTAVAKKGRGLLIAAALVAAAVIGVGSYLVVRGGKGERSTSPAARAGNVADDTTAPTPAEPTGVKAPDSETTAPAPVKPTDPPSGSGTSPTRSDTATPPNNDATTTETSTTTTDTSATPPPATDTTAAPARTRRPSRRVPRRRTRIVTAAREPEPAPPPTVVEQPPVSVTPVAKPLVVTPAPITPPPVKPPPAPEPKPAPRLVLDARYAIGSFSARGSLSERIVRVAVDRVALEFRRCYQQAARSARRDVATTVAVSFRVGETRRATSIQVSGGALPGMNGCITSAVRGVRTRVAPDVGSVRVSFKIRYTPLTP